MARIGCTFAGPGVLEHRLRAQVGSRMGEARRSGQPLPRLATRP